MKEPFSWRVFLCGLTGHRVGIHRVSEKARICWCGHYWWLDKRSA